MGEVARLADHEGYKAAYLSGPVGRGSRPAAQRGREPAN